jgi:hypothetical protein
MKYKHKRKRRTTQRKRRTLGLLGLPDTSNTVVNTAIGIAGLVGSALIGKGIDMAIPPDKQDTTMKKYAKPALLLTAAGMLGWLGYAKNINVVKSLSVGVGTGAILSAIKKMSANFSPFDGLGEVGEVGQLSAENARLIQELQANSFTPNLPALNGGEETPQIGNQDNWSIGNEETSFSDISVGSPVAGTEESTIL